MHFFLTRKRKERDIIGYKIAMFFNITSPRHEPFNSRLIHIPIPIPIPMYVGPLTEYGDAFSSMAKKIEQNAIEKTLHFSQFKAPFFLILQTSKSKFAFGLTLLYFIVELSDPFAFLELFGALNFFLGQKVREIIMLSRVVHCDKRSPQTFYGHI